MEAGHYAFQVAKAANKVEIRKAVEARYPGIQVKEIRTMIVRGKRRTQMTRRGRVEGRRAAYKKAIVTLAPGSEQIDFFEEV
jgi:large subunit ribosomal protein L23